MRRKIAVLISLILVAGIVTGMLTSCSGSSTVGYWTIQEVTVGDTVMTEDDANNIGLGVVGAVKLQKSGACKVLLLGEEDEGTWEEAEDGAITIKYGDGQLLTGSIDEEGFMILDDGFGTQYKLSK